MALTPIQLQALAAALKRLKEMLVSRESLLADPEYKSDHTLSLISAALLVELTEADKAACGKIPGIRRPVRLDIRQVADLMHSLDTLQHCFTLAKQDFPRHFDDARRQLGEWLERAHATQLKIEAASRG